VEKAKRGFVPGAWTGPAWHWRVIEALYALIYPLVKYPKSDAGRHGSFLGHAYVHCIYVRDGLPWGLNFTTTKAEAEQRDLPELAKYCSTVITKWPLAEAREFFQAFSRAIQMTPYDPTRSTATENETYNIYIILARDPKAIEALGTVRTLCEYILDRMPEHTAKGIRKNPTLKAAFQDRVEQICRRAKLKLRPRGRPPKIPTAPTV
jgi:hypothetical protein